MDYSDKRKHEMINQMINSKKSIVNNINDLISSDKLTCVIEGHNNMSFHKPSNYPSSNKEIILNLLLIDKEKILKDIEELKKQLEELVV